MPPSRESIAKLRKAQMPYDKNGKKKKVRRLVDVDVSHVSLVDRPANRTPFKAIKRETTEKDTSMNITLKNMFGSRAPEVTSVYAATQDKAAALAKMLLTGDEAEITEVDGVYVARIKNTEPHPTEQIVHLGKKVGMAYGVSHLQKELAIYEMENENFDDALKQEGFVPSIYIGMEALETTIRNIAMSESTKSADDMRMGVGKAIEDFSKYVDSLIGALPEKAFKFEKALAAVTPGGSVPINFTPEGFDETIYDVVFGDAQPGTPSATMQDADEGQKADTANDSATQGDAGDGGVADAKVAAEAAEEGTPKPDNLEELPASATPKASVDMEKAMQEMLGNLTKTVGEQITAAVKPLADRLDAQDAAVGKLTKAVGGAVVSTPEQDADNVVQLSKGEQGGGGTGHIPLIDTAYHVKKQG